MSNRAAKWAIPLNSADPRRTDEHYPRHLVLWSVLAFCLSAWAVVILAVTRFA